MQDLVVIPRVAVALGWPLGLAYGYLIKWIPFVYIDLLITAGAGIGLGVEALAILTLAIEFGTDPVRTCASCEKSGRRLDEKTTYDTLAAFPDAQQLAALRGGEIAPVLEAKPRNRGAPVFVRLTLKHSPKCEEFFTPQGLKCDAYDGPEGQR